MKQLGIMDSAFINLEHPNTPQHIGSFGIYDQSTATGGSVNFSDVLSHFERQVKKLPLFRTRLIQAPGRLTRPFWHVDDNFDVDFHIRHLALPQPGDWQQLCHLLADLHAKPLDMSKPLWESYIIEGLDTIEGLPKGCFVIYNKLHHSLVDGGGASAFMEALHDLEANPPYRDTQEHEYFGETDPTASSIMAESTINYFNNAWSVSKSSIEIGADVARSAIKFAKGELPTPPTSAPDTRFNRPVTPYRIVEATLFKLDDFKTIKNRTSTKINDVALAVVAGAMRKYLEHHEESPKTSLVATVPMNMRSRRETTNKDNNQIGSMFASLNTNIDDPVERVIAIHNSANEAKILGEKTPLADTLKLAGALSPRFTKRLINTYIDNKLTQHSPLKVNTVVSNVAGPPFPLFCFGAQLVQYHALGVLTPGIGLFHLVFSYLDQITITVLGDKQAMPDPAFYRQCLDDAFSELYQSLDSYSDEEILNHIKHYNPELIETASENAEPTSESTENIPVSEDKDSNIEVKQTADIKVKITQKNENPQLESVH